MNNISSSLQPIFKMKKTLFSLAALLLFSVLSQAQNDAKPLKVKFGKISEEELKMTHYDKDPDASAVILFDKGFCSLGRTDLYTRHVRIKIFNKSALNQANIQFTYPKGTQPSSIKGVCYNVENGTVVETKMGKENIYDEAITKNLFLKKLTIPGVREGSIIEYQYDISGGIISDWTFQSDIPTAWSEYQMNMPDYFHFSKIGQGDTPYFVNKEDSKTEIVGSGANTFSYNMNQNLWIQKDVPAFKPEKHITSSADYLTRLTFYLEEIRPPAGYGLVQKLIKSWDEEAKELLNDNDYFGFIDKKSAMKAELATLINDGMKPREKVQAIFNYVGNTFEQTENRAIFLTGSLSELQKKRKLAPSEMNLIMLNMLRTAGVEVRPVLISTRDHGKIGTPYAVYSRFDRVIGHILIENDTFFIDAASFPHPIDLLPFEDLNGGGYEFWGKDSYSLVVPTNKAATRRMALATLTLNTEGELTGNISMTTTGYDAVENRKKIKEMGEEKFAYSVLNGLLVSGKLEENKFEKPEVFEESYLKSTSKIKTTDYVSIAGDKMYMNPLLCFGDKENPFSNPERLYAVDYGTSKDEVFNLILTIPDGYKVEELPKMVRFQLGEGTIRYDYLIETNGNQIKLNTKLSIKKTTFPVSEYTDLRDFLSKIITKMGEQIVLTKITK
jgi:Domain of Unknown Function with PDB structure (DUF3857)